MGGFVSTYEKEEEYINIPTTLRSIYIDNINVDYIEYNPNYINTNIYFLVSFITIKNYGDIKSNDDYIKYSTNTRFLS